MKRLRDLRRYSPILIAVAAFLLAASILVVALQPLPIAAPIAPPPADVAARAAGDTDLTNLVLSGDCTVGDDVTVADLLSSEWYVTTWEESQTVTNGSTLTPTGSLQPITSTGTCGFGALSVAGYTDGTRLSIVNTDATTITITDAATIDLGANRVLNAGDNVTLVFSGTKWIETSFSDITTP